MTLDKQSWGNRREAAIEDFLTPEVLAIHYVASDHYSDISLRIFEKFCRNLGKYTNYCLTPLVIGILQEKTFQKFATERTPPLVFH